MSACSGTPCPLGRRGPVTVQRNAGPGARPALCVLLFPSRLHFWKTPGLLFVLKAAPVVQSAPRVLPSEVWDGSQACHSLRVTLASSSCAGHRSQAARVIPPAPNTTGSKGHLSAFPQGSTCLLNSGRYQTLQKDLLLCSNYGDTGFKRRVIFCYLFMSLLLYRRKFGVTALWRRGF